MVAREISLKKISGLEIQNHADFMSSISRFPDNHVRHILRCSVAVPNYPSSALKFRG